MECQGNQSQELIAPNQPTFGGIDDIDKQVTHNIKSLKGKSQRPNSAYVSLSRFQRQKRAEPTRNDDLISIQSKASKAVPTIGGVALSTLGENLVKRS